MKALLYFFLCSESAGGSASRKKTSKCNALSPIESRPGLTSECSKVNGRQKCTLSCETTWFETAENDLKVACKCNKESHCFWSFLNKNVPKESRVLTDLRKLEEYCPTPNDEKDDFSEYESSEYESDSYGYEESESEEVEKFLKDEEQANINRQRNQHLDAENALDRMLAIMEDQECGAEIRTDWQKITIAAGFMYPCLDLVSPSIFFASRNKLAECGADDLERCWSSFFVSWIVGASLFWIAAWGLCCVGAIILPPLIPVFVLFMAPAIVIAKRGYKYSFGDCDIDWTLHEFFENN